MTQRGKERLPAVEAILIRRPLEVIRPERKQAEMDWISGGTPDAISAGRQLPPSLLTTLQQVDGDKLRAEKIPTPRWRTN